MWQGSAVWLVVKGQTRAAAQNSMFLTPKLSPNPQKWSVSLPGSATKTGPGREKVGNIPGEWLRLFMEHPTLG